VEARSEVEAAIALEVVRLLEFETCVSGSVCLSLKIIVGSFELPKFAAVKPTSSGMYYKALRSLNAQIILEAV
jgi:hypothetical protein